jgi:hypothetical protein
MDTKSAASAAAASGAAAAAAAAPVIMPSISGVAVTGWRSREIGESVDCMLTTGRQVGKITNVDKYVVLKPNGRLAVVPRESVLYDTETILTPGTNITYSFELVEPAFARDNIKDLKDVDKHTDHTEQNTEQPLEPKIADTNELGGEKDIIEADVEIGTVVGAFSYLVQFEDHYETVRRQWIYTLKPSIPSTTSTTSSEPPKAKSTDPTPQHTNSQPTQPIQPIPKPDDPISVVAY